ncbi:MAG: peptidylprolyl isomerase [Pseudomonadota bacterium]
MHIRKTLSAAALITMTLVPGILQAQAVATIDGVDITQAMLDAFAEGQTGAKATEENTPMLLERLGDLMILSNAAVASGYEKDADVVAQVELMRRSVLAQAAVAGYIQNNPVSEDAVRAEYDKEFVNNPGPQQYKARHILVETEEAANEVIAALKDGGDFAELAKEKSTGPSGPNGGDLGWFAAESMVPEFSAAVVALGNGEYSQTPTQTQFGWHVILREDAKEPETPAYDDVKVQIRTALERRNFQSYFDGLRAKANGE